MSLEPIRRLIQGVLRAMGLEVRRAKNANLEPCVLKNILGATGASIVLDVGATASLVVKRIHQYRQTPQSHLIDGFFETAGVDSTRLPGQDLLCRRCSGVAR